MSFPLTASAALASSGLAGGRKGGRFLSLSFFFVFKDVFFSSLLFNTAAELTQHRLVLVENFLIPRIPAGRKIFPAKGQVHHPDAVRF